MFSFVLAIIALILGYVIYGKFVEKVFGIEPDRTPPSIECYDGVDYVEVSTPKAFLIQFLNIAGTGPIFGDRLHFCGLFLDVFLEEQFMIF